ncbi:MULTISPECIES: isocitrate lyase/PEP mutase family protein [Hyphomicrobiales]|jgi:2-methylisocitrate lyase-like PEP mutase family enzyme|uniref:isocitrate lyase/PEP mutase family protein n=1 Tax=Methylobacterium sp. CCH7-A2 TaxID=1768789 RepID=UPI00082DE4F4|nr:MULTISPECIES: isocitrate lyase/PEP mutase family protein [Hyphomicrobiales]
MSQSQKLRGLLKSGIVAAPGAPDALAARLVQAAGFPALYMTGFGATASRLGRPDIGLLTQTEMTTHARDMARAVSIPIIADADTGYGGPANIERTMVEYAQAGVAAVHFEDQVSPKRCGQVAGVKVIPAEAAVRRLRCALGARPADGILVIGRTDALAAEGIDEAIRRANLYGEAGADLVFVDGIKTIAEVEAVARGVSGPKVVSIVDGNETVALTTAELEAMGFSVALYAVTALFAAAQAMRDALGILKRDGTPRAAAAGAMSYAEFTDLVDLPHFQRLDRDFG